MLAIISPAKTLDYESTCPAHDPTQPQFLDEAEQLIDGLRQQSPADLQELMGISEKLGQLNHDRFQSWQRPFTEDNARAALLAFKGDVYKGFELGTYKKADFAFAQKQLRILSGVYGLLRPLDLMQPYRLEMGTKWENARGNDLYAFWKEPVTKELNAALKESGSKVLVNLASNEYFGAVDSNALDGEIVTPVFKDLKNGAYKIISFYAKKARGSMCEFMIRNRVKTAKGLKEFSTDGYAFNEEMSEGASLVFTRDEAP